MNDFSRTPDILSRVSALSSAAWAYTSLAAAFELGIVRALGAPASAEEIGHWLDLDPELVADLLGVLEAVGAVERSGSTYAATADFEPFRDGSLSRVMRAGVRSDQLQTAETFRRARAGTLAPGWEHLDPDVLLAQGETAGLFRLAAEHILPSLDGLRERLSLPGARFLDVGAGVGVLSSEVCLVYPEISADCLEPNAAAREIGRRRCHEAGLDERVEFIGREVEQLDVVDEYDLALIPQPFLPPEAFARGIERVLRALRPGGWLLVLALDLPAAEPLATASRRVRARLWGGGAIAEPELLAGLRGAGFTCAHAHPPVGDYRMFAAQRAPAAARAEGSNGLGPETATARA